jgi:hypothetical protein
LRTSSHNSDGMNRGRIHDDPPERICSVACGTARCSWVSLLFTGVHCKKAKRMKGCDSHRFCFVLWKRAVPRHSTVANAVLVRAEGPRPRGGGADDPFIRGYRGAIALCAVQTSCRAATSASR